MLQHLQEKNPQYQIYSVFDEKFKTYGKVLKNDVQEAVMKVKELTSHAGYQPSVSSIEELPSIQKLSRSVYGYLDTMAGIVTGNNQVLNGIEYHQCSETIIAVTDYVLAIGHIWDMHDNHYNSQTCELFYVPQGVTVELYSTTLHYTPICVSDAGFQTICLLLRNTGDSIERSGILKKKNKWFIAHRDNYQKIKEGDYPGLEGAMIKIEY